MPDLDTAVKEFMTTLPLTVDVLTSLETAERLFQRYDIRHLPVTKAGKLCGLVYERDLRLLMKTRLVDEGQETLKRIVSRLPLQVAPEVSVRSVIGEMLRKKHEACLVSRRGKLMGIFTVTDALKLLLDAHAESSG